MILSWSNKWSTLCSSYYGICFCFHYCFSLQFPWKEIQVLPVQWHALCLGLFASIIAPFGGFFASGFKRAFKIKVNLLTSHVSLSNLIKQISKSELLKIILFLLQDFGDSIPGHGGITDRMDCQVSWKFKILSVLMGILIFSGIFVEMKVYKCIFSSNVAVIRLWKSYIF